MARSDRPWKGSIAIFVAITMALSAGCQAGDPPPAKEREKRVAAAKGPGQQWGTAAGKNRAAGRGGNRVVPPSERGRYPQKTLPQKPAGPRNKAKVAKAPAGKRTGFDRATSRELPSLRGADQRVYQNTDGSQTTEFSAEPTNYQRPDGTWAPIDSDLAGQAGGGWRNTSDSVDLRLAARADAADLVRMTFDAGHGLAYGLAGAGAVAGRTQGDAVVYPGVRPGVDLRLESRPGTLKETLVLRSASAPATFTFPLRLTGLTASMRGRSVVLSDATGRPRAVIPPGFMVDSAATPARSEAVSYQLVGKDLKVTVDSAWLRDPARTFPVLVDPTVGPPVKESGATQLMTVRTSSSVGNPEALEVGRVNGQNTASYVKFGGMSDLRNHQIFGAALVVTNFEAPSCRARPLTVHPVTQAWTAGGGFSYPGPSYGGSIASQQFAYGYIPTGQSQSSCPMAAEMIDLGVAGSTLVQRWANGQQADNGLTLRASTSDSLAWKKFGAAGANPPKLYVTHTPYNATYAIPKPVPEPAVLRNQDGKVQVAVTNLGADAWTPSDYYLAYRAYDTESGAAVTQQRSANLPRTVARGESITLDATIKAIEPGNYFLDFTMVRTGGDVFTDHQVPPGRIVLQVFDVPPVVAEVYPPNGYQTPTLTPLLWARAIDTDAPPGSVLQYKFELCDQPDTGAPTNCQNSGYQAKPSWPVPSGRLAWSKNYVWRAYVKDGANEVTSPDMALLAAVPQPDITSRIANAPYASQDTEYDAQVGNYRTAALDAAVTNAGPELNLTRTYNSLDPRTDSAFGAGWSSRYDMKIVPDDDGSGNVVVTYPDGQAVRFGRNLDGTFAAPPGRTAKLSVDSSAWTLQDKSGAVYRFALAAAGVPSPLSKITDIAGRSVNLTYTNGKVTKVQASNSQTSTAGRALTFTWNGNHVATVSTDKVDGAALTWTYTYTGDLLTKVCPPAGATACTVYDYAAGSHYRSMVLDGKPEGYWRLGDGEATAAASSIAVNLGKDAGTYRNVTVKAAGAIAGVTDTAATFNGTNSAVELPKGTVKKSRDAAVEVWFKVGPTQTGGPLIGYQDKALGTASGAGVPVLYTGTDGRLRGQFGTGTPAPLASTATVWDDRWHHAVLSVMGSTQTLYLDGAKVAERAGAAIEHSDLTVNQIGAAYATSPATWTGWGGNAQRHFQGGIDEVAVYSHPLGPAAVLAHYRAATTPASQMSRVTLPSGRIGAEITYDVAIDRIKEYTDDNGGTWKIGAPLVYGNDSDLRRSVQVLDPANRPQLFEYDALAGRLLRTGLPVGLETRPEDTGLPTETPPDPPPTTTCPQPDPQDPAFCTVIPGDAGGPVFVRHTLDGLSVRSFEYDEKGNQKRIVNENGDTVTMGYDARGNVESRTTCREDKDHCFTTWSVYPATADPYDPRGDLVIQTRDGRSASKTDDTYLTTYTYDFTGQPDVQTNPDGSRVDHDYSNGTEPAAGGGQIPPGLITSTKDARGKQTRYSYFQNGDLAKVTTPSGMFTEYTYDPIGRRLTEKETTDTFPAGLTSTYTYETNSKIKSVTRPVTTDAVTGVKHQQQVVNEFDADGNVTKVTIGDLLGGDTARVTTTEYDEHGHATLVTDPEGGETTYAYDRFGNKVSEVDACGNRYDYAYTARNKQAEVRLRAWRSDPEGTPSPGTGDYLVLHKYSYDFAGRLASDTDAMGRRLEYRYYGDDLLQKVTLVNYRDPATGATREHVIEENTYNGAGHLTRKAEGNGTRVTTNTVDRVGKVLTTVQDPGGIARTTTFTYDENGNTRTARSTGRGSNIPGFETQPTDLVTFDYDDAGNALKETVTAGTQTRVTSYTYDRRGLRLTETDPRGLVTNYDYDEAGRQVRTTAPAVTAENPDGTTSTVRPVAVVGYDTFGGQTTDRDPLGNVTRNEYDKLGRAVRTVQPSYVAPGASQTITPVSLTSYDPLGNVIAVTTPGGSTTRFTYDQLNRLVVRDEPGDTEEQRRLTRMTYTRTGQLLSTTGPTGARAESTYDDLDRAVTTTQIERYPQPGAFTSRIAYDDAGNARSITGAGGTVLRADFDTLGQVVKKTEPTGEVQQFGYDYRGRQVREVDAVGRATRAVYNQFGDKTSESDLKPGTEEVLRTQTYGYDAGGNLTTSTDPDNHTTTYVFDGAGQLSSQIEPVSADKSITTSFGYDVAGNRTRYTDGRGNVTRYTYNSLGRKESVVEPATAAHTTPADRTWTVAYDRDGLPTTLTAPGNVTRTRTYDAAGRMRTESGAGAEAATGTRTLGYDLAGRLASVNAPTGTDTFSYNDRGALLGSSGPSGTATFGYDADGNLATRTDAAGTATFGYDRGRLKTVTDGLTSTTQTFGYDAAGAVKTIDYGAGRVRTYAYDDYGHLASDTLRQTGNTVVASVAYGYDRNGHVTSKTTAGTAGSGTNTYEYDWAGRLTAWTGSAGRVPYAWDDSGNRIRAGAKTATYDERNRLLSDGDFTYAYTARGTLRTRTSSGLSEQYSFDAFDRLISSQGQNYTYDGLDRVSARNSIAFTYAGASASPVAYANEKYAHGPGDDLVATQVGTVKRLTLADGHGDIVAELDPADPNATKPAGSTAYSPWGERTATEQRTSAIGFQGDWTDPATGQVDMGARWYQPGTGTFTSRDNAMYTGGDSILANKYTYGAGAPLDFDDPDGHWPNWVKKAAGAVSNAASSAWNTVKSVASTAWNYASSAISALGSALMRGAEWLYNKAASAVSTVVNAVKNGVKSAVNWAKQTAAAAAARAQAAAKAVTAAAKKAVAQAVKYTPLPVLAAVTKPLLKTIGKVVSTTAKLAASVVSVAVTAITDPKKFATTLYQAAAAKVGAVIETVSKAAAAVGEFVAEHKNLIIEGLAIVGGIAAGLACTAITAGAGALACMVGAAALVNLAKDAAQGNIHSWKDAAFSAGTGAVTGLLGAGAGAIGAKVVGGLAAKGVGAIGRAAAGAVTGGVTDAVTQYATTGRVDLGGVALAAGLGAVSGGRAKSCGGNSFTGDTAVLLADGEAKPITEVEAGDTVKATDPTTGRTEDRMVTDVIVGEGSKNLVDVTVEVDAAEGSSTAELTATEGHPFWVESVGRWVNAADLQSGYRFETADHRSAEVVSTRSRTQYERVYNLTVDGLHTYYVLAGTEPVLVHNCGGGTNANGQACSCSSRQPRADPGHVYRGGRHGDLKMTTSDGRRVNPPGIEINHMPPHSTTGPGLSFPRGPAIQMDRADHAQLYSTSGGPGSVQAAYREMQRDFIARGDVAGAMWNDINDVRSRFGTKYDGAILEMLGSLDGGTFG
ncbi:polymorphic toxin-type HINT domain-containing protein [Actinoplanes sp. NPDC089786]|uniref:polymorphic toxin-type HINT domain-containing protein n=1 Tax=Actinoplanes sp. NPDC089786 TaxID=3155185 RepID=UPI00342BE66C